MSAAAELPASANEALIQFLYRAPIGLLQAELDGAITMINPMSAQLLMPFAPGGHLDNLFDALARVLPDLCERVAALDGCSGVVCEALRVSPCPASPGLQTQTLEISVLKLDAHTLMASVSDITLAVQQEQQRLESQLRDATRTDNLTSMPNRAVVLERIEHALARARADADYQFAVMFINGDRFSRVNDTFGSGVGDELLRMMSDRLNNTVRLGDAVGRAGQTGRTAARLSGDEFVVVLESLRHAEDAHGVAQRLVYALSKPYGIGAHQLHATASLGVVLRAQAAADADAVLQDASIAMRAAKRDGGDRYCVFEPAMKELAARRGNLETELRQALARRELFVVYQPIVALVERRTEGGNEGGTEGDCVGMEALVRWRHPTRGTVPPIEFIEIAEETGLIGALGLFVLTEACHQFARWQQSMGQRAPRTLSVNLSRAQLSDSALVGQVRHALEASGVAARHLQLEVTETLAAQDPLIQQRLHELKALGLTLALDDFGTGYSSLASLHLLPVDVVKIDRSFVSQSESSGHHRILIEATVRVARSLGMQTVAEGIETEGQATILSGLCCDKGQGYLYSRPLPAAEATRWLAGRARAQAIGRAA